MWDKSGPQHAGRADPNDIIAEIDAIEAPADPVEPAPPHVSGRFKAAMDAWRARHIAYLANPNTYEALLAERRQEENRKLWRAEYAVRVGRPVRATERGQTPERRAEKKAAKSKEERARRDARSTPEQIAARKEDAKARAKASRERNKQAERPEGFGKF